MKRWLILGTILLCYGAVATAAGALQGPIQDVTVIDGVAENITAGETDTVTMAFRNTAQHELPVYVTVTASSGEGINGDEFTIDAGVYSENGLESQHTELSCRFSGHQSDTRGLYFCSDDRPVLPRTTQPSENTLYTTITSAPHTVSGTYQFTVNLYSTLGIPKEAGKKRKTTPYNHTRFTVTNSSVTLNTSTATTAAVKPLADVIIPPPTNTTLINGVEIEAPATTLYADSSVRFNYTPSAVHDASLQVYHFNTDEGGWRPITHTTHQQEATVTADINRTGIYGLFGTPMHDDRDDERDDPEDTDRNPERSTGASASTSTSTIPVSACTADDWSCTGWSTCTDGTQTRHCEKTSICTMEEQTVPQETRNCTLKDAENETVTDPTDEEQPGATVGDSTTEADDTPPSSGFDLSGRIAQMPHDGYGLTATVIVLLVTALLFREQLAEFVHRVSP